MGTTCHNIAKVFSPTDDAYNEKFIKRHFIMGIFIRNHSKIDKTEEGVEGPAGQLGPKSDQCDTGPKRKKGGRGLIGDTVAQGAKGEQGDKVTGC